jgi:hypothetical protein
VIKPLVGVSNDGPSDAAVVRPDLTSSRGLVIACGMNPRYGAFDTYHMAASAIDEAIRNCVAVGADPAKIAILDNFCWGYTDRPETLGSLVRAAIACHDLAVAWGTPFISGKDSLNNEFSYFDAEGNKQTIAIPPTLLISALGQVEDVSTCVTMDLKREGSLLYVIGQTRDELGGSHWSLIQHQTGGQVPTVNPERAKRTFTGLHRAIQQQLVRACHDLSEGGLAACLAEMAFAGEWGVNVSLDKIPHDLPQARYLFILNRNETIIPAVAKLKPEQAAYYFMLGETKGTSAGGAHEAGKSLRVPGTNPFWFEEESTMGNRFLELLETFDLEVYLLNTGRVGGGDDDERSKKVRIEHSAAVQQGIVDGTIEWVVDPDFGYEVAASIPGFDDDELLQPRKLYERQGRGDEYQRIVDQLATERAAYLDGFEGLDPRVRG